MRAADDLLPEVSASFIYSENVLIFLLCSSTLVSNFLLYNSSAKYAFSFNVKGSATLFLTDPSLQIIKSGSAVAPICSHAIFPVNLR